MIVKSHDEGSKAHQFPHALVAGVERYPTKVGKSAGAKKAAKRSKVKPFIKAVNFNHLLPTRYTVEIEDFKAAVSTETFEEPTKREEAKKLIKKAFEDRYQSGKNKWFFTKLNF